MVWLDLDDCYLEAGAPVMALQPDDIAMSGDVGARFAPLALSPY